MTCEKRDEHAPPANPVHLCRQVLWVSRLGPGERREVLLQVLHLREQGSRVEHFPLRPFRELETRGVTACRTAFLDLDIWI